uniref:Uncharacterized protein n=1 Tax=Timema genevievae TaxID=629358 RepID=A0A7R9K4Y1_TIMGE|nr:unnamed protein product [Timema genevievae]
MRQPVSELSKSIMRIQDASLTQICEVSTKDLSSEDGSESEDTMRNLMLEKYSYTMDISKTGTLENVCGQSHEGWIAVWRTVPNKLGRADITRDTTVVCQRPVVQKVVIKEQRWLVYAENIMVAEGNIAIYKTTQIPPKPAIRRPGRLFFMETNKIIGTLHLPTVWLVPQRHRQDKKCWIEYQTQPHNRSVPDRVCFVLVSSVPKKTRPNPRSRAFKTMSGLHWFVLSQGKPDIAIDTALQTRSGLQCRVITETDNMEDSSHFSESESDEKERSRDVSIKDEIKLEQEMVLNPQENANLTVKSEIPDSYEAVSSPAISWIKQEIELANALVVLSSTAEDGEIQVRNLGQMEENSPEYVDVSVNSEELDLYQRESVCDLPFIKEEPEVKGQVANETSEPREKDSREAKTGKDSSEANTGEDSREANIGEDSREVKTVGDSREAKTGKDSSEANIGEDSGFQSQTTKEIVNLTHQVGFTDVDEEYVSALLQTQEEDDLLSMEDENCVEVSEEDEEPKCVKVLTGKGMSEAFQMINNAISYFENNDPDETRSRKVKREVEHVIKCCRELYNSKLKSSVSNELETSFSESTENVGHE